MTETNQNQDSLLQRIIMAAQKAHVDQLDKARKPYLKPYLLHPMWVMNNLTSPESKIGGILHAALMVYSVKYYTDLLFPTQHLTGAVADRNNQVNYC